MTLSDSSVICQYLEDRWPEPAVYPRDVADRARARWLEEFADTRMGDVFIWRYFNQLVIRRFVWGEETDQALVAKTLAEDIPAGARLPGDAGARGRLPLRRAVDRRRLRRDVLPQRRLRALLDRRRPLAAYGGLRRARARAPTAFQRLAPFEERLLRTPIPEIRDALAEMGAPLMRETYGTAAPASRRDAARIAGSSGASRRIPQGSSFTVYGIATAPGPGRLVK